MTTDHHAHRRLVSAATALGTFCVTLVLLAGLPYVLWRAAGVPWPDRVSSLADLGRRLAQPMSDPLVIELLAVAGWFCWAAFACTVVRELIWYAAHLPQLLHDRRVHDAHLAALSLKGSLAALCIGTLVVALLGLWRPQNVSAQQLTAVGAPGSRPTAAAPLIPSPASHPLHALGHTQPAHTPQNAQHIEYTVIDGDNLWDIAKEHLGDGLKWPRIYALNKDRVQPDGHRFSDPELIRPGWRLTVPVVRAAPVPPPPEAHERVHPRRDVAPWEAPAHAPVPRTRPSPAQQLREDHHGESEPSRMDSARPRAAATEKSHAPAAGPAAIGLGEAGVIGITMAAGLLAARRYWHWYQRRLRDPETATDVPALSPLVDKAAQAAHAATLPRTPSDPGALVTRRTPHQPPRSADAVTIGVRDNTEVHLDALALAGGCTWTGPGAEGAARALLAGILTAAERQRPAPQRVTAVVPEDLANRLLPGLPPQFTALAQSPDTAQAVRAAEYHLLAHAHARDEKDSPCGAPGAVTANAVGEAAGPGTLVLLTAPDAIHTGQLQALASRSSADSLIILTLNAALPGAETWNVANDGTVSRPEGPESGRSQLRLFHLTPDAGHDMTDVLLTAHGQRPHLRVLPASTPHPASEHAEAEAESAPDDDGPTHPIPAEPPRPANRTTPVRLHVFGPITLYAAGHPDPIGTNLRPEVHEFLALLAAHPAGLLATDIAEKLHLEPGSDQNALKNLRRAVRRALRSATGITAQEFILRQGEFHKLHPDLVETDLTDFTSALNQASRTAGTGLQGDDQALAAVQGALSHYRGPFAQGGDYLWADTVREHLAVKATDAALRLARAAERTEADPQRRDAILALLEHLGTIHPDHERLAQHTIRLYQVADRYDAARHTYARLERHLADLGLQPEPPTKALIAPRTGVLRTSR